MGTEPKRLPISVDTKKFWSGHVTHRHKYTVPHTPSLHIRLMQATDQCIHMYVCMQIAQGNMNPAFARGMDIFGQIPNAVSIYIIVHTYVRTYMVSQLTADMAI